MLTWAIGLFLAGCIGISLGMLGGGGSILAVPILIYVMGVPIKAAIAMSLMIVGTVSLVGAIPHWRAGHLNLRNAMTFGATTMLGAFLGAKAAATLPFITGTRQLLLFAGLMLMAAVLMIRSSFKSSLASSSSHAQPQTKVQAVTSPLWHWFKITLSGLGVGLLTGLVGVGGGFAIVPALVLLLKTPMKEAVGTSLLIIAMNSGIGFLGYFGHVALDWILMFEFMFVAGLGILAGTYLSQFVPANQLQKGFGFFLLLMSAFILFENRQELGIAKPSALTSQHHNAFPQSFASAVR